MATEPKNRYKTFAKNYRRGRVVVARNIPRGSERPEDLQFFDPDSNYLQPVLLRDALQLLRDKYPNRTKN